MMRLLLSKAKSTGDTAGQLSALRYIADCRYGLTGRPEFVDAARECVTIASELGYQDDGARFRDPESEKAMAKSLGGKAAQFQELRLEVLKTIAKARAEVDSALLQELYQMRDKLTQQGDVAGLRLDSSMRFVPGRG